MTTSLADVCENASSDTLGDHPVWLTGACVVGLSALLTLFMAAPVLSAPDQRIFGTEIVGRHHDPFTVMGQFAGAPVGALYYQPATDGLGRLLARVIGPVAAYNVVVLATFPLAAWFGYVLAIDLTASRLAAVVAALAFAFSPFHVAHAAYHPHVAQVHWIALFLLAIWRCVHGWTWRRGALLVAASALVASSNFYGGFIAAAIAPAALVLFWLAPAPGDGAGRRSRSDLLSTTAVLGTVAAAGLLLVLSLHPDMLDGERVPRAAPEDVFRYSARWWAHLMPPVDHAVLGAWSREVWGTHGVSREVLEQQLYLGYGLIGLAGVAVASWVRRKADPELRLVPCLLVLGAFAGACALSPSREIGGMLVVRPSAFLYEVAPMFRSYARFSVVVQLMIAVLGGLGARTLWTRGRAGKAAGLALIAVAIFEYAPAPWRWRDVLPTTGHRWLANQGTAVRAFDCSRLNLTDRPTAFLAGHDITYADPAASACGEPSAAARFARQGITHVILRPGSPAWPLLESRTPIGLRQVYRARDSVIFQVTESSPQVFITSASGWYPREYSASESWRWTAGAAALEIVNPYPVACSIELIVELGSFDSPRRAQVFLNATPIAQRLIGAGVSPHAFPAMVVPPGRSVLALKSVDPPVAPATIDPGSTDRRPLAILARNWLVREGRCGAAGADAGSGNDNP